MKKLLAITVLILFVLATGTVLNNIERCLTKTILDNEGQQDDIRQLREDITFLGFRLDKLDEERQGLILTNSGELKGNLGVLKDKIKQLKD
jgi:hypothetical protein